MTDVGPSILTKGRFLRLPDALKCTMETKLETLTIVFVCDYFDANIDLPVWQRAS